MDHKERRISMRGIRIVVFSLSALMMAGLGFLLVRSFSFHEQAEMALTALGDEVANTRLSAIHHVAKRDGVREWTLDAESARYEKAESRTVLEKVSLKFFLEDGNTVHVTGSEGVLHTDTMDIDISGDVIVASGSRLLKTDRLHYVHGDRCVFTDTPVLITGEGIKLAGNYMRFSLSRRKGAVWGGVEAVIDRAEMVFVGS
jgi:lipopolysaccharide export system protein LptC